MTVNYKLTIMFVMRHGIGKKKCSNLSAMAAKHSCRDYMYTRDFVNTEDTNGAPTGDQTPFT